ncbi:MAG TPA: substrate-binding domain-containing protein [Candidatus Binatia bacterium]|nr:substrate-binding domain-containing protein [Candidatus Binatia bacterium]
MLESPSFLYQEIAESVRRRIASGELAPGDRLAAVRVLAKEWSCTPGTVNRAYLLLADDGLVVSQRGRGTHVAANVLQPDAEGNEPGRLPSLRWATLVNRAEQYVLEATGSGFSESETQTALAVAFSRWRAIRGAPAEDATTVSTSERRLRFSGSHDLILETIAAMMETTQPGVGLRLAFTGSLGGLMALLRGEADVAGAHLWDEETDTYNVPFVQRILGRGTTRLVTLAHRSLGLLLKTSEMGKVSSLADLAKPNVRFVNRQRGSGTRTWLDAQLRRLNVDGAHIAGYEDEVVTHMAVAERVASGKANVGLAIYAAAAAFGLHFVPLTRERYDLVFMKHGARQRNIEALVKMVRSDALHSVIEALGGYDASHTGREWPLGGDEP